MAGDSDRVLREVRNLSENVRAGNPEKRHNLLILLVFPHLESLDHRGPAA